MFCVSFVLLSWDFYVIPRCALVVLRMRIPKTFFCSSVKCSVWCWFLCGAFGVAFYAEFYMMFCNILKGF